jgi:endonuclease YncB( thermonuclease family)
MTARFVIASASALLLSATVGAGNTRTIARVHPGCVLELEGGWQTHLTGIQVATADTDLGRQALAFCAAAVEGRMVRMFTLTTNDRASGIVYGDDGLAFAEILYGDDLDRDLAAELLRRGLARVDGPRLPDDLPHYRDIEQQARTRGVGVWASSKALRPDP